MTASGAGGLSRQGLDRWTEVAAAHVDGGGIPGLVALVASGDEVHVEALGSLSLGGAPVRRDSLFRIASTTKPVTAVAALTLVDEGLVALDDDVGKWLPEMAEPRVLRRMDGPLDDTVAAERPITVRDLLSFTMGFGCAAEMFGSPDPWPVVAASEELQLATLGPPDPAVQPDPDTWIARLGSLPLLAQPGVRWLYNTGASVLGVLVARVAGQSLGEVLRTRVLEPLGMSDTAFFASDPSRLPTAYAATPDGLAVWDPPDGKWSRPPAFADGAAGLVSTIDDLLALARMLLGGGRPVLPRGAVAEMTRNQLTVAQAHGSEPFLGGRGWGLGLAVDTGGDRAGAYGWNGGLGTSWLVDPVRDLVVIVLTQRLFETALPPKIHQDLQAAAYQAIAA